MSLEYRFKKFVELNMAVQDELQQALEKSILQVIPDNILFHGIRENVQREFQTSRNILAKWQVKVKREVLQNGY